MKKTHMKNSLSSFTYFWKSYPSKEVKEVFDKNEFMVTVNAEKMTPPEESV